MKVQFLIIALTLSLFCAPSFQGQEVKRTKIGVVDSCDDRVGTQFVYAIKEQIRGSHAFQLIPGIGAQVYLSLVCLDDSDVKDSPVKTAMSVMLTKPTGCKEGGVIVLYHSVYVVGVAKVDEMAKELMANVDKSNE